MSRNRTVSRSAQTQGNSQKKIGIHELTLSVPHACAQSPLRPLQSARTQPRKVDADLSLARNLERV